MRRRGLLFTAMGLLAACQGPQGEKGEKGDPGAPGPPGPEVAAAFLTQPVPGLPPQVIGRFNLPVPDQNYFFVVQQTCGSDSRTEAFPVPSSRAGSSGRILSARWEIIREGVLELTARNTGCYYVVWQPIRVGGNGRPFDAAANAFQPPAG